jgi:outer membrane protein TolC
MKTLLTIIAFLFFASPAANAGEIIKKGELINVGRCVEIALKRQPNIIAAANTVKASQSKVGQARANYYPQVDLTSGYSRENPVSRTNHNSVDQYTGSVIFKQNIYDFGKTSTQVNIQSLNVDSSKADMDNVTAQIILNVKQAYYGALQAKRTREVAYETVKQFQSHLEQAKGFYEAGTKPKIDVTKAEVDLSNARLNLIKAENALRVTKVILDNAMGVPNAPEYIIEDNLSYQKYNIELKDAVDKAYQNRPDLKSTVAKKSAAGSSIELAKKGYYPTLSGNALYNRSGERFPLGEGWETGVTLSFPIFSGFLTKHQVEESEANLNVLKANEELLRQNIFLEVQQAYLNLKEAEERIPAAELIVKQAEENLELANGRYAAGLGNPIEVTDAQIAYSNAKTSYIQALSDYNVAMASLEKAMGVR